MENSKFDKDEFDKRVKEADFETRLRLLREAEEHIGPYYGVERKVSPPQPKKVEKVEPAPIVIEKIIAIEAMPLAVVSPKKKSIFRKVLEAVFVASRKGV